MSHGINAAHTDRRTATARKAFIDCLGEAEAERRAAEIAALPLVQWRGRPLRTLRCHGERGMGPHDANVPEALLWSLISLRGWRCVYHQ
jgi:hypothetical protein